MTAQHEQRGLDVGELITVDLIEAARAQIGVPAIVQN